MNLLTKYSPQGFPGVSSRRVLLWHRQVRIGTKEQKGEEVEIKPEDKQVGKVKHISPSNVKF